MNPTNRPRRADRLARERRGRGRHLLGDGGVRPGDIHACVRGRQHRLLVRAVRRHLHLPHALGRAAGVSTRFVDPLDYEGYADAIDEDTAYVHLETIGNPALVTPDIERIADIAHDHGVPLFVDNTFATPYLCRPLDHGADLVWESTTKWLTGNGTTVGGVLVDGGSFPWSEYAEKYPEIAQDNPAYHGINYVEAFGDAAFTFAAVTRGLRDLGDQQSPFDAWNTLQQTESLPPDGAPLRERRDRRRVPRRARRRGVGELPALRATRPTMRPAST